MNPRITDLQSLPDHLATSPRSDRLGTMPHSVRPAKARGAVRSSNAVADGAAHLPSRDRVIATHVSGARAGRDRGVDRTFDGACLALEPQGVAKQHGDAHDRTQRVGDSSSCDVRCGSVDRLVQAACSLAERRARQKAERAGQYRGFVGRRCRRTCSPSRPRRTPWGRSKAASRRNRPADARAVPPVLGPPPRWRSHATSATTRARLPCRRR